MVASLRTETKESHFSKVFENLIDLIPSDDSININADGDFVIEYPIPLSSELFLSSQFEMDKYLEDMIVFAWNEIYHKMTAYISEIFMKADYYHTVKLIPSVFDGYNYSLPFHKDLRLRLRAEISVVDQRHTIVYIPEWVYINDKAIEWRCGHCVSPNPVDDRHCTQCGAPRALLIQEMMCLSCGRPKNDDLICCDSCGANYKH